MVEAQWNGAASNIRMFSPKRRGLMKTNLVVMFLLVVSVAGHSQETQKQAAPATVPAGSSPAVQTPEKSKGPAAAQRAAPGSSKTDAGLVYPPDRSAAYYHYGLAHIYEEMVAMYGRSEYATKAIEEYNLAIEADPSSQYLNAGLAELYAKTGRIRDALLETHEN